MARMKRLQISLEPELDRQLGIHARKQGISKAEVVRRSLQDRLEPEPNLEDDPLFQLFGTFDAQDKGLKPGESIDEALYGPGRDDLR